MSVSTPLNPNPEKHNKTMDTAIIDAWEHRRVREDDDAYVSAAYEREDQRAADDGDG
jgi:hypothetical protein